jgi:hypothetical protein
MTKITLPYDLANKTPADAIPPETNFNRIEQHINQELIERDGSVAMRAQLRLVGDPVGVLDAAPKQYVDSASRIIAFEERTSLFSPGAPSGVIFTLAIPVIGAGHRCRITFHCSAGGFVGATADNSMSCVFQVTSPPDLIDTTLWPAQRGCTNSVIVVSERLSGKTLTFTPVGGPGNVSVVASPDSPAQGYVEDLGVF